MSLLKKFTKAIERNNSKRVKSLLSNREVDANVRLPRGLDRPALVHAAWHGHKHIVELLLNAGARIDDVDDFEMTACHHAAQRGNDDVLALLIARGANLALDGCDGKTALYYSLAEDRDKCSIVLIAAGAPLDVEKASSDLVWLAASSTDAIQTLINRGIMIRDLRTSDGRTPLHYIGEFETLAGPRSRDVISMLVNVCGVDLEDQSCGETCIHVASQSDRREPEVLRCFVELGADVDAIDDDGNAALHIAHHRQNAITLLAAGADVHLLNSEGNSPLRTAFVSPHSLDTNVLPIVHALLAAGADLDAAGRDGLTVRQILADAGRQVDPAAVEAARRAIAKERLDFVRERALQVCIGLQSLRLNALQTCEIMVHACGPLATLVAFHHWWKIATTVKHFKSRNK